MSQVTEDFSVYEKILKRRDAEKCSRDRREPAEARSVKILLTY